MTISRKLGRLWFFVCETAVLYTAFMWAQLKHPLFLEIYDPLALFALAALLITSIAFFWHDTRLAWVGVASSGFAIFVFSLH